MSFDLFNLWSWQCKRKWVVVSGSEPQLHIGFIVSRKFLFIEVTEFSLKQVSNLKTNCKSGISGSLDEIK